MKYDELVQLIGKDQTLLALCLSGRVADYDCIDSRQSFFKLVLSVHPGPKEFDPELPIQRLVLLAWKYFYDRRVSLVSWLEEMARIAESQPPEFTKRLAIQMIGGFPQRRLSEVYVRLKQVAWSRKYEPVTELDELAELLYGAAIDGIDDELELAGVLQKVRMDSFVRLEVLRRLGSGLDEGSIPSISRC